LIFYLFEHREALACLSFKLLEGGFESRKIVEESLLKGLDRGQVQALNVGGGRIDWLEIISLAYIVLDEAIVDRYTQ
jgi:hypothetical protein